MNSSNNPPLKRSRGIFLIGFMGSGKTHWGKIWAKESRMDFYDLDEVIEYAENRSITAIFEEEGENYFRDKESTLLKSFAGKENFLLACGGGVPCFNDNMQWMNDNGITVYLSATAQYIYDKVLNETRERPLLKNIHPAELLQSIDQKIKEREPFYKQAKIILPVDELTDSKLTKLIS